MACVLRLTACHCRGRRPGVARHASNFLLRRQKKVTKEKATPLSASPALRAGATCGARGRGAPQNSLRAVGAPFKQLRRVRARSMCVLRHTCHPAHCAPRRIQRGWGRNFHSGHCFAALRSAPPRGRKRHALRSLGRAKQWPEWLFGCLVPHPCWLRLRRGGCGVSMGVAAPMLRELTRRGCPSGARSAKRVPRRTPQPPRRRFAP